MGETRQRFPLFPLGLVLLPQEVVPLHIFEPRYRTMIAECLEFDTEFGIVWLGEGGLREVGCCALIEQVLEQFEDGRMNIVVRGGVPFRLLRRIDDLPYPAGDVELLDDEDEDPDDDVAAAARERYADLVERATDERPTTGALAQLNAYAMVANVEIPLDAKQELLEQRSESQRLDRVGSLFAETLVRLDRAEEIAERARTNGKAHG
jgi:Lon protease-like protein